MSGCVGWAERSGPAPPSGMLATNESECDIEQEGVCRQHTVRGGSWDDTLTASSWSNSLSTASSAASTSMAADPPAALWQPREGHGRKEICGVLELIGLLLTQTFTRRRVSLVVRALVRAAGGSWTCKAHSPLGPCGYLVVTHTLHRRCSRHGAPILSTLHQEPPELESDQFEQKSNETFLGYVVRPVVRARSPPRLGGHGRFSLLSVQAESIPAAAQ